MTQFLCPLTVDPWPSNLIFLSKKKKKEEEIWPKRVKGVNKPAFAFHVPLPCENHNPIKQKKKEKRKTETLAEVNDVIGVSHP